MYRPQLEIADIFEKFPQYIGKRASEQWKVINAIRNCRTRVLGGHQYQCKSCDYKKNSYNSCRNRHCPKCQFTARTQWIEKRFDELLPCEYFHVVFTLPSELRTLILQNKKVSYDILFKAASETLKEVAKSPDHLGADIGCIGVLHTWGQNLVDHPHVHFIVPSGGLNKNGHWVTSSEGFLLPIKVLSKVFRGKILNYFEEAFKQGDFNFMGQIEHLSHPSIFNDLMINCSQKEFIVYSKKPFAGPKQVISYLGGYTHRIAISNYRLVKLEGEQVHFKVRDNENKGQHKTMSLHAKEFIRRLLLHTLPKAYVRIRHFGLLGNRMKKAKVTLIRKLHGIKEASAEKLQESWKELLLRKSGVNIDQCPKCEEGTLEEKMYLLRLMNSS